MVEIRWHGRGGQGAKTAALLLADAVISSGKYVQAFPEYGPERRGAPVRSFNRIDKTEIRQHSPVVEPDVVVVLDATLIESAKVTEGLKKDGVLLVNTAETPGELRKSHDIKTGKVYTVDASTIALDTMGLDIPNTPMLGALARVTEILDYEEMLKDLEKKLSKKFRGRPEIVEGNLRSVKRAYEEVKQE
ncbi:pyruvate synthase [candidate division TA06 bacterium DG_26]|uniref:Pyruvate synthase n=1 Tax=candidate division TA06 bacterium DG_26 TaxID=1703771 RepID=A0A0S7WMB1_UNCT6|nr:MAG: pyruvate synthase [candidate division TA06 bacterium DG_26]